MESSSNQQTGELELEAGNGNDTHGVDGVPSSRTLSRMELEQLNLQIVGANQDWLASNAKRLYQTHPEWIDCWLAVASGTQAKVLAVSADRLEAIERGLASSELREVTGKEGVAGAWLFSVHLLSDQLNFEPQ